MPARDPSLSRGSLPSPYPPSPCSFPGKYRVFFPGCLHRPGRYRVILRRNPAPPVCAHSWTRRRSQEPTDPTFALPPCSVRLPTKRITLVFYSPGPRRDGKPPARHSAFFTRSSAKAAPGRSLRPVLRDVSRIMRASTRGLPGESNSGRRSDMGSASMHCRSSRLGVPRGSSTCRSAGGALNAALSRRAASQSCASTRSPSRLLLANPVAARRMWKASGRGRADLHRERTLHYSALFPAPAPRWRSSQLSTRGVWSAVTAGSIRPFRRVGCRRLETSCSSRVRGRRRRPTQRLARKHHRNPFAASARHASYDCQTIKRVALWLPSDPPGQPCRRNTLDGRVRSGSSSATSSRCGSSSSEPRAVGARRNPTAPSSPHPPVIYSCGALDPVRVRPGGTWVAHGFPPPIAPW